MHWLLVVQIIIKTKYYTYIHYNLQQGKWAHRLRDDGSSITQRIGAQYNLVDLRFNAHGDGPQFSHSNSKSKGMYQCNVAVML